VTSRVGFSIRSAHSKSLANRFTTSEERSDESSGGGGRNRTGVLKKSDKSRYMFSSVF